jgi:hypothetical protein
MMNKIDDYVQRPVRYRNIDGLWEMGLGLLTSGISLLDYLRMSAPTNSVWHWRGASALGIAVLGFVVFYGVRILKKRITYPRTGFVKYRGLAGKPWITGAIAGAIAIATAIFFWFLSRRFHFTLSVTVALASGGWGFLYALATKPDAVWRWIVFSVILVGPVAISTLPLDRLWLDTLPIGFLGLTFLVSGGITLYLYLRRTRPPEQEAE